MYNEQIESNESAIVIGGSITGLLSASVLAEKFTSITIVERDVFLIAQLSEKVYHSHTTTYFSGKRLQVVVRKLPWDWNEIDRGRGLFSRK